MPLTTSSVLFPRLQPALQATPRHEGSTQALPIDSPLTSETIVYVVCKDVGRITCLKDFFLSHVIRFHVFDTAREYLDNAAPDRIACVIVDLDLPDANGLEVQRRLLESGGPPVIFVASHGDLNSGVRAMKNGAIDFMIEPFDYERLLAAVEAAFVQERKTRRERVERLSLLRRWNSLTPREQESFRYTVAGFLNKQAAGELGITENTFQVHRGRVMRKMKADSLAELVRMSMRLELLLHNLGPQEIAAQHSNNDVIGKVKDSSRDYNVRLEIRPSHMRQTVPSISSQSGGFRYADGMGVSRIPYPLAHSDTSRYKQDEHEGRSGRW